MKKTFASLAICAALFTGCGDSTNLVSPAGDTTQLQPVAVDDNFTALGNSLNRFPVNSVYNNDTRNGANILAFDRTTANGGTIAMDNDGSFDYTAPTNFSGTDQFNYRLQNSFGISTATVRLQVDQVARFVDNSVAGGDGSQGTPFSNLADALAASDVDDVVFIFAGDGTSVGAGGNLQDGQQLIGEGEGLVFNGTQVVPPGNRPLITGTVNTANNNTIAGFDFQTPQDSITAFQVNGLTVRNNTFTSSGDDAVDIFEVSGTTNIVDNTFTGVTADAIVGDWSQDAAINIIDNVFNDNNTSDPDDAIDLETTAGTLTAQVNGNLSEAAAGAAFNSGIELETGGTGSIALTANGNTFRNMSEFAINILPLSTGTIRTMFDSLVTSGGTSRSFNSQGTGDVAHLLDNSNLEDNQTNQVFIVTEGGAFGAAGVRNTTVNSQVLIAGLGTDALCVDVEGITAQGLAIIDQTGGGSTRVEELATVAARNTVPAANVGLLGALVNIANGACNF